MTSFIPYPRNLVKTQELTNQSYCIWLQVGNNTDCFWDLTYGEWYWSDKLSDIYIGFKDVIVDEAIKAYFQIEEGDVEISRLPGSSPDIEPRLETISKIHERISEEPNSFEQLNDMIMDTCEMFKSIDVPMNITLVKGFGNCIPMLMAHDMYDPKKTGKEMLEKDYLF